MEGEHRWGENEGVGPTLVAVIHHIHVSAAQETATHRLQLAIAHQTPRKTVIDAVLQILVIDVALENAGHRLLVVDAERGPCRSQNHLLLGFRHVSLKGGV